VKDLHITEKMLTFVVVFKETVRVGIYSLIIKGNEHENFILFRRAQEVGCVFPKRLSNEGGVPALEGGTGSAREGANADVCDA
jgi:hypothetical protein